MTPIFFGTVAETAGALRAKYSARPQVNPALIYTRICIGIFRSSFNSFIHSFIWKPIQLLVSSSVLRWQFWQQKKKIETETEWCVCVCAYVWHWHVDNLRAQPADIAYRSVSSNWIATRTNIRTYTIHAVGPLIDSCKVLKGTTTYCFILRAVKYSQQCSDIRIFAFHHRSPHIQMMWYSMRICTDIATIEIIMRIIDITRNEAIRVSLLDVACETRMKWWNSVNLF